jgi:parallel beta-helix repeat protein
MATPYKTLQYAVNNRLSHAKSATGNCVTINLMDGTYTNTDFGTEGGGSEYILDLNGLSDVIIKNHDETTGAQKAHAVVLKFDGPGGFRGGSASKPVTDVEITGFEIAGPNNQITYKEAIADRFIGSNRFSGQGISIWAGYRIWLHHLKVHDTPAAGLRVNNADYLVVEHCEVYRTTWWSRSAESAIVFAQSANIDESDKIKMIMRKNKVYNNMNKIPYYNKNYAYDYFPIGKDKCKDATDLAACKTLYQCCGPNDQSCCEDTTKKWACPWQCRYGKASQDYVIDGQGVYVTRNSDTYLHGTMELSDNIAYNNGINGLVFHRTHNGVVKRNIVFNNGQLPKDSQEKQLSCKQPKDADCWKVPLSPSLNPGKPKTGRQPYSGLTLSNSKNVMLWSNVVKAGYPDDKSYEFEIDAGHDYNLGGGGNNKNCRGKVTAKIQNVVQNLDGTSQYEEFCAQSVLAAKKA